MLCWAAFSVMKLVRGNRELEEDVMKDVAGWQTGTWYGEPVYFTLGDRWWDPDIYQAFAHSSKARSTRYINFYKHDEYSGPHWYHKYLPKWMQERCW